MFVHAGFKEYGVLEKSLPLKVVMGCGSHKLSRGWWDAYPILHFLFDSLKG